MLMMIKTYAAIQLLFCNATNISDASKPGELEVPVSKQHIEKNGNIVTQFTEKKLPEDTTNKKYATIWGGDISFWKNDSSYGYTARGLGQEIYKDNETRIIEKLVIPWLLLYTNQYRKENGLDTLKYDQCLLKAAGYQTDYLFNESKKDHQFKLSHYEDSASQWFKGVGPSDRALAAGCKKYCGENALYNNILPIPATDFKNRQKLNLIAQKIARNMVFEQWHNSKGHRDNMLFKGYSILGVSVAIGKHYSNDSYINDKGEKMIINNSNTISWIAFGIQVMAY
jgi:hypothetical protein